jgi:hypothetical protein
MTARDAERRAIQDLALLPLGVSANQDRIFAYQARGAAEGAAALRLPVDTSLYAEIGVVATGAMYFMMEKDPLDGTNALA